MNPEHSHHRHEPRHHAAQPADGYIADVVANAPTPDAGRIIDALYAKYAMGFALYLTLDGVDKYPESHGAEHRYADAAERPALEAEFKNVYYDCFPDRESIIDDTIASFDWGTDLNRLLRDHPELRHVLTFDRDAIWGFASDQYEIIDGTDGLHVFERRP